MNIRQIINSSPVDVQVELDQVMDNLHKSGPVGGDVLEKISYFKKIHPDEFQKVEKSILYLLGLFYKVEEPSSLFEYAYNLFKEEILNQHDVQFTPVQDDIYHNIKDNKFFSFSAPTSTGKSYVLRELIRKNDGDFVVIVPSRALISEYMQEITSILSDNNDVLVLQYPENINKAKINRRIYVLTPERAMDLFKINEQINIKILLLDEAQLSEEEIRGLRFDAFVRRFSTVFPESRVVFSHPFIFNPEAQLEKHKINIQDSFSQRYEQLSVGKIFLSEEGGSFKYFSPYENKKRIQVEAEKNIVDKVLSEEGTILVYVSKAKIYSGAFKKQFSRYLEKCIEVEGEAIEIIERLEDFIGAKNNNSEMINMMKRGVVIHHGSIPLGARLIIEEFINSGFAKICFSTSTLSEGINMPFDVVWIDYFRFMGSEGQRELGLKNLIGRAGRITSKMNNFDYGYVVVKKSNISTFSKRLISDTKILNTSILDSDLSSVPEDLQDVVEAIKKDDYNIEYSLPNIQVNRLREDASDRSIEFILTNLFTPSRRILSGEEYVSMSGEIKREIKGSFQAIYLQHLRRGTMTEAEKSVLSTAITILLWRIQGKSFKEIIGRRKAYLIEKGDSRIRYSPEAAQLPDRNLVKRPLFSSKDVKDFKYDVLVFDTYDYLDKVISFSLSGPLSAAFDIYFKKTEDIRASILFNYVLYGTNDDLEIWLIKYGFSFEEIEWVKPCVESVNEFQIFFNKKKDLLSDLQKRRIKRYL